MKRPIIALDFASRQEIGNFLDKFPAGDSLFVKVGMELFYQEGPEIVHWLRAQGHDVFLDLKLHDIPNTVASAMKGIAKLGVKMTNVHAAGGEQMMRAALTGLIAGTKSGAQRPILLAVTQLTSTSEKEMQQQQLIPVSLVDSVTNYAQLSQRSGLDGVVCSALEVGAIKQATTKHFSCLTPGIRPRGSEVGDQKRVVTPEQAHQIGSDYIVVGRPITQSATPYEQYQQILQEWNGD